MLWKSVIIPDFMRRGEDNRGNCADNLAGRHPIRTIDAHTSNFTPDAFSAATSQLILAYAGLHTWRLGYVNYYGIYVSAMKTVILLREFHFVHMLVRHMLVLC